MYAFRLAFRNIVSRKSSIVIILFITFAISLLLIFNAIFDGTDYGLEEAYAHSYTGDLVIVPEADYPLSLFGDETPVTGNFSTIPLLESYKNVKELVEGCDLLENVTFQVTGAGAINVNDKNYDTVLFGIDAQSYFKLFPSITLLEGDYIQPGQNAIMLSKTQVEAVNKKAACDLHAGDRVRIASSNGTNFSIRLLEIAGIYEYKVSNAQLDRIMLIDAQTCRELMGIDEFYEEIENLDEEETNLLEDDFDIDDLFSEDSALFVEDAVGQDSQKDFEKEFIGDESVAGDGEFFEESDALEAGNAEDGVYVQAGESAFENQMESAAWNFIICECGEKNTKKAISYLNGIFKEKNYPVKAVDWRTAAGGSVSLVNYMRLFLNIGLILIMITGCIVINNALTVQALNRIQETGTLRSMGAKRAFIAKQSFFETALLTITAGILGCLLGILIGRLISGIRVPLNNYYLKQLFGTNLVIRVTGKTVSLCMLLSLLLTFVGWLFPLRIALNTSPVTAMRSAS